MNRIEFGVSLSEPYDAASLIEISKHIEGLGFESLWLTENVYSGVTALETLIALGVIATSTQRVRFGPAVLIMPLRNPVALAHATVTLDRLSGGRFVLGVGAGGESKATFDAYAVPMNERGRRCDEMLELMVKLWTGESVSHHGRFWSLDGYGIGARSIQHPHPPIWLAGARAETVLKRAARWADGFYPSRVSPSELTRVYERIYRHADEIGRDMSHFTKAVYLRLCLGSSRAAAKETVLQVLEERYQAPVRAGASTTGGGKSSDFELDVEQGSILGPPEECAEAIQAYIAAGAEYVVVDTCCPRDEIPEQVAIFMEQVAPHFS